LDTHLVFYILYLFRGWTNFLQGRWCLYNIYSAKQWRRANRADWIKVLWPGANNVGWSCGDQRTMLHWIWSRWSTGPSSLLLWRYRQVQQSRKGPCWDSHVSVAQSFSLYVSLKAFQRIKFDGQKSSVVFHKEL
jgi:hypothetical protein